MMKALRDQASFPQTPTRSALAAAQAPGVFHLGMWAGRAAGFSATR